MQNKCLFCSIVSREVPANIIAENSEVLVFADKYPLSHGHVLLITKKHYEDLFAVEQKQWNNLLPMIKEVAEKLQCENAPRGFNFISNIGEAAYQSIKHFHFHLIPKYKKEEGFI